MTTKTHRQTDIPASTSGHRLITGMASEYAGSLTGFSPGDGMPPPPGYSDAFAAYVIGGEQVLHTVTNIIRFLGHTGGHRPRHRHPSPLRRRGRIPDNTQTPMTMRIYISIPITGTDIRKTREKADLIKARLSRDGHTPVSPFDIYAGKNPTYEDYLCSGLQVMLGCDAVFFCKGWDESCGCSIEYNAVMRFKAHGRKYFTIMFEH